MHGDTDLAARALSLGLGLAPEISLDIEADLCLRSAYVLRDFGRFRDALAAVGEAGALYGRAGDSVGMAKTQVDRGALLYPLGDLKASVRCYRQALKGLPLHMSKSRAAAYHGLGVALHGLGEPGAEAQLGRAATLLEHEGTYGKASSLYAQANLARERVDTGEAETLYRAALELLRGRHQPLTVALVTLDLLEILLQQGKLAEARAERRGLNAILATHLPREAQSSAQWPRNLWRIKHVVEAANKPIPSAVSRWVLHLRPDHCASCPAPNP